MKYNPKYSATHSTVQQMTNIKKYSKKKMIFSFSLLIMGIVLIPGSVVVKGFVQKEIDRQIANQITLPGPQDETDDTKKWRQFMGIEASEEQKGGAGAGGYYLFNLTNEEQFIKGAKPILEEIGPFVYQTDKSGKLDVTWNEDASLITYKSWSTKKYDKENSWNKVDDTKCNITNINPGYLGILANRKSDLGLFMSMFPRMLTIMQSEAVPIIEARMAEQEFEPGYYLPEPIDVFYNEWFRDRFPCIEFLGIDWNDVMWLFDMDPVANIDIDGRKEPEKWDSLEGKSRGGDLNITIRDDEWLNTREQDLEVKALCDQFWDPEGPYSLTNGEYTKYWFEAMGHDVIEGLSPSEAKQEIFNYYNQMNFQHIIFNEDTIQLIVDWIELSMEENWGWMYNIALWSFGNYKSGLIIERSVEEWLFTGIDGIVNMSPNEDERALAKNSFFRRTESYAEALEQGMTTTTLYTGLGNINDVKNLYSVNGKRWNNKWNPPQKLEGTDGRQFHPGVTKDDRLKVYNSQLGRTAFFTYVEEMSVKDIPLLKFKFAPDMWQPNPDFNQENELINLTTTRKSPIFLSPPHFYGLRSAFKDGVIGLNPSEEKHDSYIGIQPDLGTVLKGGNKMQINGLVKPTDIWWTDLRVEMDGGIYMPLCWQGFGGEIPDELADELKSRLFLGLRLREYLFWGSFALGMVFSLTGILIMRSQIERKSAAKRARRRAAFSKSKKSSSKYKDISQISMQRPMQRHGKPIAPAPQPRPIQTSLSQPAAPQPSVSYKVPSTTVSSEIQIIDNQINAITMMINKLEYNYKTGIITEKEYIKKNIFLTEKILELRTTKQELEKKTNVSYK